MHGLGRLIALPFLLFALAVQGLAPAQAQAMPRDAFGFPICSGSGHSHPQDPGHGQPHDCCAAACALAGLAGGPPAAPRIERTYFGAPIAFHPQHRTDGAANRAPSQPRARGPPAAFLTV
jgi:hypothetical protein